VLSRRNLSPISQISPARKMSRSSRKGGQVRVDLLGPVLFSLFCPFLHLCRDSWCLVQWQDYHVVLRILVATLKLITLKLNTSPTSSRRIHHRVYTCSGAVRHRNVGIGHFGTCRASLSVKKKNILGLPFITTTEAR
jgi:hypothetical protein